MKRINLKSLNKACFLIVLIILMVLTASVITKGKVLVIEDKLSGVHNEFYLKDNSFILSYTHSVHKTIFQEFYIVTDDNKLLLQKNVFDSFGVGSPYIDNFDDFKIENGKFVLKLNRSFKEVNMVISPIPNHKLTIDNQEIKLLDLLNVKTNSIKLYALEKYILIIGNKSIILLL